MMEDKDVKSKFNFNPTVCKNNDFNVVALGKKTIGQTNLLHWVEYLDYEIESNSSDRTVRNLFERCMVSCALKDSKNEKNINSKF